MFAQEPLSIYIHIPFCSVRCAYCAFNTYTDLEHLMPAYVDALCKELEYVSRQNPHQSAHTLFFGGGTPSLVSPHHYRLIFQALKRRFALDAHAEISLEANPNDLGLDYLRALRRLGFNRLSIGMQSASTKVLQQFDRRHDLQMTVDALAYARQAGFDNVNLDVIFGSPGESLDDWKATVDALRRLAPEHISMYGLELKGGTALRLRVDAGEIPAPDEDLFADMYEYAAECLALDGYVQYEISNWCRPNRECRHNLQYWRNLPYVGLGAGAHGFAGGCRYSTMASPQRYIAALNGAAAAPVFPLTPAVARANRVDAADDLYETIMMGLRLTREGINRPGFKRRFGQDFVEMFPAAIAKFQSAGLLKVKDDRVHLSDSGRLLSNAVIRELV